MKTLPATRDPSIRKPDRFPPAKRRLFWLITILSPFGLLLFAEVLLRAFHYGPDLSLFSTIEVAGRTYLFMNPAVKSRYFTDPSFNPSTSHDLFLAPKPEGTYRVFCLGGSTIVGYPYWYNGAPSTFLRDRLARLFPSRHVEVVNIGMTAINSYAVADLARDLARYEPDLFIVYDGHNEFYGALGVASNVTVGGYRWVTRLYLDLIHVRIFILLRDFAGRIAGLFGAPAGERPGETMMEQLARGKSIPYRSPLYARALDAFRANLLELRKICEQHNIPLILSTQVSNLRSLPPFDSGELPAVPTDRRTFEQSFGQGTSLYASGEFAEALEKFRASNAVDSLRADSQYWMARCLDTLGDRASALSAYVRARDYDQLRFRCSSDFNEAIRAMSDGKGVGVADVESVFAQFSPAAIVDSSLIFEHLHPHARGFFLMAKEFASVMRHLGLLMPSDRWTAADTIDEEALWDARPITAVDEIAATRRNQVLTSRWPFPPGGRMPPHAPPDDILGTIADRILTGTLTWEYGHVAAAEYYEGQRKFADAEREYRALINQYPRVVSGYLRLGRILQAMGNRDGAERVFLQSLDVERTPVAYRMLGRFANNSKRFSDALTWFSKAIPLDATLEEQSDDRYSLALVCINAGMFDRGKEELRQLLTLNPHFVPAQKLLQRLSAQPESSTRPTPVTP